MVLAATLLSGGAAVGAEPAGAGGAPLSALVVGSNRGGPGQEDLRFAEDDARRFAETLVEIGGYPAGAVRVLLSPGRAALLAALDEEKARLAARAAAGEATVFTFFYSGHARASALALGADEVPLDELRQRLLALPATVRVAILDGCQTGAISQIKGASPARDFSFNSVAEINTAGAAIIASSTASELSQESESLRGSYFTHHLLVGLRGAADSDGDGRVTLQEAYRYAYHRTLVATAVTAVGRQHVTLENDLRGKGEMVLTWPARASAQLELPRALRGDILVQRLVGRGSGGAVVAEISKAPGETMKLALPAGSYTALVREGTRARRCDLALADGATAVLPAEGCTAVEVERAVPKQDGGGRAWGVELAIAGLYSSDDGYIRRLGQFGFESDGRASLAGSASVTRSLGRFLTLALRFDSLQIGGAERGVAVSGGDTKTQRFDWFGFGLGLWLRAGYPFRDGLVTPYVQVGGGLSLATSTYTDDSDGTSQRELDAGYLVGALGGLEIMPSRRVGFFFQGGYLMAPSLSNLLGDRHDTGGAQVNTGLRLAF